MSTTSPVDTTRIDRTDALATLVVAFSGDPVMRWMLPGASRYLTAFPEIAAIPLGPALEAGAADSVGAAAGVAVWLPPGGSEDDEAFIEVLQRSVDPQRQADVFGFMEQADRHRPQEPHWYLPLLGVDPRLQGRGYGTTLLAEGLARCDEDGLPAYLDASSPRNRLLYERHGFQVRGEVQAGDSPPIWPMLRPPVTDTSMREAAHDRSR